MTDPSGYAKTLALPAGFDAPRLLRYDDVTAHAITRDDLGADVRGINASLDLIRETRGGTWPTGPVTEEGLRRPGPARVRVPGRQVIQAYPEGPCATDLAHPGLEACSGWQRGMTADDWAEEAPQGVLARAPACRDGRSPARHSHDQRRRLDVGAAPAPRDALGLRAPRPARRDAGVRAGNA
jgi:hypothetical protein